MNKQYNLTSKEAEELCRKGIAVSCAMTKSLPKLGGFDINRCYTMIKRINYDLYNPIKKELIEFTGRKIAIESCGKQQYMDEYYTIQAPDYGGYFYLTTKDSKGSIEEKIKPWNDSSYYYDTGLLHHIHSLFLPAVDLAENTWFIEDFFQSLNKIDKGLLLENKYTKKD